MKIENQAVELDNGSIDVAHTIHIQCPHCGNDVSQDELDTQTCADCGGSLEEPKQSVHLVTTSIPLFTVLFE
jgi:Zn finger protein HypA/HybF involved in hydrogenase expression